MTDPLKNKDDLNGFTDVTGPAAFKAQMLKEQEEAAAAEAAMANIGSVADEADGTAPAQNDAANFAVLQNLQKELADTKDQLLRAAAETENLRKRFQREREDALKFGISSFAKDLLDVADNFRRALDAIPEDVRDDDRVKPIIEGIEATERTMLRSFEKAGIKKLEPQLDEAFNPNFHEVMFEAPVAGKASGAIIQVIETGYMLHERLLRPARVGVAKGDGSVDPARNVDTSA
jgi:molecular chaperone GrpE